MIPGIQGLVAPLAVAGHTPVWTTVLGPFTSLGDISGWNGYTMRWVSPTFTTPSPASSIRATMRSANSGGLTVDAVYVQTQAAAGNVYDASTTMIQVKKSGSGTITIAANSSIVTDGDAFALPAGTYKLVFGLHFSAASAGRTFNSAGNAYYRAATNQASTIAPTGAFTATSPEIFSKIELLI